MGKTHFISIIEKKLSTLLNTLYCEEDIYRHPYRKCLSLKEWKQTYVKSHVDFSSGYKISVSQFGTLFSYAKRMGLMDQFEKIGFVESEAGYFELKGDSSLETLYGFLEQSHISGAQMKRGSFLALASKT